MLPCGPVGEPSGDAEREDLSPRRRASTLVEDEPTLLTVYARALQASGMAVTAVGDGRAAITALASGTFDVIVSDIGLPHVSGLDFLRLVRASDLDLPVILMTGAPSARDASHAIEYGAFRYLSKPIGPEDLVEIVRKAATTRRLAGLKRRP